MKADEKATYGEELKEEIKRLKKEKGAVILARSEEHTSELQSQR